MTYASVRSWNSSTHHCYGSVFWAALNVAALMRADASISRSVPGWRAIRPCSRCNVFIDERQRTNDNIIANDDAFLDHCLRTDVYARANACRCILYRVDSTRPDA